MFDSIGRPLVVWPCYEPAGEQVALTENELVRHVLLLGSTGCGKSTLLAAAMGQILVRCEEKVGLLVLDAKADGLADQVRDAAWQAGRSKDVMIFGPEGDHTLDLFEPLGSLQGVEAITRRIMLAADPMSGDNAYWQTTTASMYSAAFSLYAAAGKPVHFSAVMEFLRRWFMSPTTTPEIQVLIDQLERDKKPPHPLVTGAIDQAKLWQDLDLRTRSVVQSCLLNVLRPLQSAAAASTFATASRRGGNPAQAATVGAICVASVNALAHPELARFLFRLAKQVFFEAVQQRSGGMQRLCGIVADELPLVVTREDASQLATLRSKRCFFLGASQGLHALAERIGTSPMHALLTNFNTTVFMRSTEAETAIHAQLTLGTRTDAVKRRPESEGGGLGLLPPCSREPIETEVPVCPIGALAKLDTHQGYVARADGSRTLQPVWFVPWFEQPLTTSAEKFTSEHVKSLMERAGFKLRCSPCAAASAAANMERTDNRALQAAVDFFRAKACMLPRGLDTLPTCWLRAIPGILWRMRKPHWQQLPFFIDRLKIIDGLLVVGFAQEEPQSCSRLTLWDRIRIGLNASLYPSPWRAIKRHHALALQRNGQNLEIG